MAIKASATITIFNVDDVDSLDVGGRNLVLDSKNSGEGWTSTTYLAARASLSESWIDGQVYTVQVKGTCDRSGFELSAYNYEYNDEEDTWIATTTNKRVDLTLDSDTGIWSNTFDCPTIYDGMSMLEIYISGLLESYNSQIEWIKLEKGNTATDWTPAPEDIQTDVLTIDASVTSISAQVQDNKDQINNAMSSLGQEIADAKSELDEKINSATKYFTFDETEGLIISTNQSIAIKLVLDNDMVKFVDPRKESDDNGGAIAYWDAVSGYLYTGNLYVLTNQEARFGNFAFRPREDGSLTFSKVG